MKQAARRVLLAAFMHQNTTVIVRCPIRNEILMTMEDKKKLFLLLQL